MSTLHPVFQAALAPYLHRTQPRITTAYNRKPTDGTETFYTTLGDVPLECKVYWEAADPQTWSEPGYPAQATIESAKVGGVDIIEILSDDQREQIETAFLESQE